MLNRRGFIGSAIGLLTASQLPFIAEKANYKVTNNGLQNMNNFIRLFNVPIEDLHKCRIYVELDNDEKIWAPFMLEVKRQLEGDLKIEFVAKEIKATKTFTTRRIGLIDDCGYYIRSQPSIISMRTDDKLKVTYNIAAGF